MAEPLNYVQRVLHHRKVAAFERRDEFKYLTEELIKDLVVKVNEIIEVQNQPQRILTVTGPVEEYLGDDESLLLLYPGYDSELGEDEKWDVVLLPDLYPYISEYQNILKTAISRAKKRVVFGFYDSLDQHRVWVERYLNMLPYQYKVNTTRAPKLTYVIEIQGEVKKLLGIGG